MATVILVLYQSPSTDCITRLITVIPIQQQAPIKMGFPPLFTSLTMLLFSPMADMARTMKNLLRVLMGLKKEADMPALTATVVMMDAPMKKRIKKGKICRN